MAQRMPVLFEKDELEALRRAARAHGLTLAEWVRQALRAAAQRQPEKSTDRKISAIRAASQNQFPAPDMVQLLEEIEAGYGSRSPVIRIDSNIPMHLIGGDHPTRWMPSDCSSAVRPVAPESLTALRTDRAARD